MTAHVLLANIPGPRGDLRRHLLPRYPSLALASLAAVLRREGADVSVIDAEGSSLDHVVATADREQPELIGISASMPMLAPAVALARRLRERAPRSLLVVGGPLAASFGERLVEPGAFHVAVQGEGESTLLDLLARMPGAAREPDSLAGIPGTVVPTASGIVHAPARRPIDDLDALPLPAFDLLPAAARHVIHPLAGIHAREFAFVASRGCPYHCPFCYQYPGKRVYRHHSVDYVIDALAYLRRRFGVTAFRFLDDVFTLDRAWALCLAEALARRLPDVTWHCGTRVDLVDAEVLGAMARAGCRVINFGLESGGDDDARHLRKPIASAQREAIALCRDQGIRVIGQFILGFPWDTRAAIRERIRYAYSLGLSAATFWPLIPFPGTELHEIARNRHGEFDAEFVEHVAIEDPGPLFAPVYSPPGMSRRELAAWTTWAQLRFYGRPEIVGGLFRARQ